jgi:hypothetical protein
MALWLKALLWIAIVLLPGGLLLVPVAIAFRERERRGRAAARQAAPDPDRASHRA